MKNSLLALALIVVSATAFCQVTIKPDVRAGVNFANITYTDLDDKTDFYIGAFAKNEFVHFYALQPKLNHTRQGGKSKLPEFEGLERQYLSLSVANKSSPFNDMGLHFIVGPAINIKTGDNNNLSFDDLESFDIVFFGSYANNEVSFDEVLVNKVIQLGAAYKFNL